MEKKKARHSFAQKPEKFMGISKITPNTGSINGRWEGGFDGGCP